MLCQMDLLGFFINGEVTIAMLTFFVFFILSGQFRNNLVDP